MHISSRIALASFGFITIGAVASAQSGSALESYQRARAVLDRALVAHGAEAAAGLHDLTIAYSGVRHMRYQSHRLDRPWDTQRTEWRAVLDYQGSRMRRDYVERYPKDFEFSGRQVYSATGGFRLDPSRQHMGDAMTRFTTLTFDRARAGMDFEIPVFLVQRALRRTVTLRSLGQRVESGRRLELLTFSDQDGSQVGLRFDASSGLLAGYETVRDDGIDGDISILVGFDGYRSIAGVQFPTRRVESCNGAILREGTLETAANTRPADSLFAEPAGYVAQAPRGAEAEPVRKLAENVWLIQQLGNRVMFVAFDDHVVVLETPLPHSSATTVMDIVRRTVPGKPIRYVVFTHHHDDHAGGLRPYIAAGITIVTTPSNRRFIERVATARHTISPDTLSRAPRAPVIETFSGKRVFSDRTMTLELLELGPNSHVDEMVFAWLPRERLVFQGDLLMLSDQGEVSPANTLSMEFLRKVDALGLPVETIAGVHGRVGTIGDLRSAVAKRR